MGIHVSHGVFVNQLNPELKTQLSQYSSIIQYFYRIEKLKNISYACRLPNVESIKGGGHHCDVDDDR